MRIKWGDDLRDNNENWFHVEKRLKLSSVGLRQHQVVRWTIWGVVKAATKSALTTALAQTTNSFSTGGKDLLFLDDDGVTATDHFTLNAGTLDGTQVVSFGYLPGNPQGAWGSGTEYTLRRTYKAVIEAKVLDSEGAILQWFESVRTIGDGGPKFVMQGALTGPVQRQQTQQFTPYVALQMGRAVGHLDYPFAATSLWPASLHRDKSVVTTGTPKFGPVTNTEFPISWRYVHESATALIGGPTGL